MMTINNELRSAALEVLRLADPDEKCRVLRHFSQQDDCVVDALAELDAPQDIPGRPHKPRLVRPKDVPQRDVATTEGRAALLHAIAHIEFNAIGLALDAVWRFPTMPEAYYRDWFRVAIEEAHHFSLLRARLHATGFDYGDFDAHDGLWQMACKTSGDVLARMALVPRTLEARGLDASPWVRQKLAKVGDEDSARVIDIILRDEIGHVAIGNHWFRWLCGQRGWEPKTTYARICQQWGVLPLRGPINEAARLAAGFESDELVAMQR
ncbi:MAG TPA: ferritin-like domain-containing protein [Burkholderiaceae bacterium]|nr:ferritin-like domain-containing protein [Burkholderiaceae bacterium]